MNTKVLILLGLAALVAADSRESFESGEAKYDFNWAVKHDDSGNDFGHQEGPQWRRHSGILLRAAPRRPPADRQVRRGRRRRIRGRSELRGRGSLPRFIRVK
ncbi:uncharacterized protein LOC125032274 [Penaeus chinensis]|uniref:uncharacterized protein LOC125032274 n=1 Tax=Penaeus chinensis TaxID=139456 RepID=UPI001FB8360C|nr:uncharacterized protein LOC125032274 [Penaeus chinensis]